MLDINILNTKNYHNVYKSRIVMSSCLTGGTAFAFRKYQLIKYLQIVKNTNMITLIQIILMTVLPFGLTSDINAPENNNTNVVNFYSGSFESGQNKAKEEGRLFFVEFYADWCTPCKWMDKTTFKNDQVVEILNDNYVPLKLDIETNEGDQLKGKFEVRMLPTILIFNSEGRMVERVEKTLSSESMVSLLSFHNNPTNRVIKDVTPNVKPSKVSEKNGPGLNHLYSQYKMAEKFKTNYKLQVGNHMDYVRAFEQVKDLKDQFIEPIVVMNDYVENKTHYKVLLGEFKTISEAESFRKILKDKFEMDAIIY